MSTYQRGAIWWYEFVFRGQRIRESSDSENRDVARQIERERRRKLEYAAGGVRPLRGPEFFKNASKKWLEMNEVHWSTSNLRIEKYNVDHLLKHFGGLLLADISGDDVARYQAARKKQGASPRTINMEVGTLRAILRKHRQWTNIQPDVRMLKVRQETGRALSGDEQHRLLLAARRSRSRSLYPAILLSLHTGLRNAELRLLRWRQVDLLEGQITVGKSKTAGGEGRGIPLSQTALQCIKEWRSQFPDAQPAHYVFPSERYGFDGEKGHIEGRAKAYDIDVTKPIASWKTSWTLVRSEAKVDCRWHDLRHSFVSTLAESQASDATIMALAGHLSRKMMERYSHTRNEAKRAAISVFDLRTGEEAPPQIPPQGNPIKSQSTN
jgi:integrase